MQVRVLYFGILREAAGEAEQVELSAGAKVADIFAYILQKLPAQAALLERCAIAVNQSYAERMLPLYEGDEVAILPPVSGGANVYV